VRSVIPTPAEKQSGPMEIGTNGCHRNGPTSSSSVEAANHQLIRESRFTLGHPARWVSTTGPGARGPSLSRLQPRCADAAPGPSFYARRLVLAGDGIPLETLPPARWSPEDPLSRGTSRPIGRMTEAMDGS
jgi:hypothetical protein